MIIYENCGHAILLEKPDRLSERYSGIFEIVGSG
jgi:hypothetical protein